MQRDSSGSAASRDSAAALERPVSLSVAGSILGLGLFWAFRGDSMGGIIDAITGKKDKLKITPPEKPASIDEEGAEAAERERRRRRLEGGRASTILTSPLGLTAPARTATKTLTGS